MQRLIAILFTLSLSPSLLAALPLPVDAMRCTRSATLVNCTDRFGNHYGIVQRGNDTLMRGFDALSGQRWAQTSSRYGRLQLFTGVTNRGETWFGSSRRIGWNVVSRLSSSEGTRDRVSCNRLGGCR